MAPQTLKPRVNYSVQMPNNFQKSVGTIASSRASVAHFEDQRHDFNKPKQSLGKLYLFFLNF